MKHTLQVEQTVYYEVSVEASTREEAVRIVEENAEELDLYEVDNSPFIVSEG